MLTSHLRFTTLFLVTVLLASIVSLAENFDDDGDFLQIQVNDKMIDRFKFIGDSEKHLITSVSTDDAGNIIFSVENTGKRDLTLDLMRYFYTKVFNETKAGTAFIFGFSLLRYNSNGHNDWMAQFDDFPEKYQYMITSMNMSSAPRITTPCRHISLYTGERFAKHEKIWELPIWEVLVSSIQKYKSNTFKICFILDIDLSGKQVYSSPEYTVDQTTLRRLQNLERTAQRQEGKVSDKKEVDPFRATLSFSPKTGDLEIAITSSSNLYAKVSVDLNQIFGSKEHPDLFLKRFTATSQNGVFTALELPSIEKTAEYRTLHLEQNETISKRCKIWDIAVWSEILAVSRSDRIRKFELTFPVVVETIDYTPNEFLNHAEEIKREKITVSVTLTIDYRTMLQMEKLREASQ